MIQHTSLHGDFAAQCEGRIIHTLEVFKKHIIDNDNCELLAVVIKAIIEKQLDKYEALKLEKEVWCRDDI